MRIIIVLYYLCLIATIQSSTIPEEISAFLNVVDSESISYSVYREGVVNKKFDPNYIYISKMQSCTPPIAASIRHGQNQTTQTIKVVNKGSQSYQLTKSFSFATLENSQLQKILMDQYRVPEIQVKSSEILKRDDIQTFLLTTSCPPVVTNENYWSPINVQIGYLNTQNNQTFMLDFTYEVSCKATYPGAGFSWSIVILVLLSFLLVTGLARFSKIYSFTYRSENDQINEEQIFQGFILTSNKLVTYLIVYLTLCLLCVFVPDVFIVVTLILIMGLGFAATFFFFNEILCLTSVGSPLRKKLFLLVRVCDILSLLIALVLLLAYSYTKKAWYVSDMIAICIVGSFVKLFKLTSLKISCLFLIPCALMDMLLAIIVHYTQSVTYNILVLKYYNYPSEIELPEFSLQYQGKCQWISILSVLLPGLFIGYCYRFDRHKGKLIYTILSFTGLMVGEILWMTAQVYNPHSWPQSIFTYWLMLGSVTLCAKKRGELKTLWSGNFYDSFLVKNVKADGFFDSATKQTNKNNYDEYDEEKTDQNPVDDVKMKIDRSIFQGLSGTPQSSELFNPMLQSTNLQQRQNIQSIDL